MTTREEIRALVRLGYDPLWLESGILTHEDLARQMREISREGGDPSSEHYRAATLDEFLGSRETLTDAEIRVILELGTVDPDLGLRPNFAHQLIRFSGLTLQQFDLVAGQSTEPAFQKIVTRWRLLRRLAAGAPLAEVFDEAIESGDGPVHEAILERDDLTRMQVAVLAEKARNRGMRNRAQQMLRSKRFRQTSDDAHK